MGVWAWSSNLDERGVVVVSAEDVLSIGGRDVIVRVIASARNWVVGDAVTQLKRVAELPGVVRVVGMPDLHPGKGVPIGAAVLTEGYIYPHLAGNDIGCGMGLWQTDLEAMRPNLEKWAKKLKGLERPWDGEPREKLNEAGVEETGYDSSLGTIGGGNHFAELQAIERVEDGECFELLGLDRRKLVLMVHSGSRGLGESVLRRHVEQHGSGGLKEGSAECERYLAEHDQAVVWARCNRGLIAERFAEMLSSDVRRVLDLSHNSITGEEVDGKKLRVHRKGAAPATGGPVVIPGSRGSYSYLVEPIAGGMESGFSLAHGAGRKWARSDAKGRLEKRYSIEKLQRTELGSHVICEDRDLIYEEAPQAYKDIEIVIEDLVEAGLVKVVAVLRPLISYKTRKGERE